MDRIATNHILLPLSDPKTQIRLLRLHDGLSTDAIAGEISHWYLDHAPPFRAVSYTWGQPERLDSITVDGSDWLVRENCKYALWQARLHHPDSYIWIDSICINQQDNGEKSAQVAMMGDVYQKAAEVLACVGPADESSEYMCKVLSNMDDHLKHYDRDWVKGLEVEQQKKLWCTPGTESETKLAELLHHFNNFCARSYFSRVWIVQELFGGGERVKMICGNNLMSWQELLVFHVRMYTCFDSHSDVPWSGDGKGKSHRAIYNINAQLVARRSEKFQFPVILTYSKDCTDSRDRIYGILNLLDWERFGVPRIVPDYSITAPQLALQAIERTMDTDLRRSNLIASSLEVELDDLVKMRLGEPIDDAYGSRKALTTRIWTSGIFGACRIYEDTRGCLQVDLAETTSPWMGDLTEAMVREYTESRARQSGPLPFWGKETLSICTGSSVSVFACQETLPGDFLVSTCGAGQLVLRPTSDFSLYKMIGKAIVMRGYKMPNLFDWNCDCRRKLGQPSNHIQLAFELSDEQVLLLGAARGPARQLDYASFSVPREGTLVKDVSSSEWRVGQKLVQLPQECQFHGTIDSIRGAEHALYRAIEAQSGGGYWLSE